MRQDTLRKIIKFFKTLDPPLIIAVLFVVFWGVINMYSATVHEFKYLYIKQGIFALTGITLAFAVSTIDYRKIAKFSIVFYLIGVILLVIVLFKGKKILGATRWISIGPINIQPSEFMKLIIILVTARVLGQIHEKISFLDIVKVLLIVSIPVLLILKQPDLGTSIMVLLPVLIGLFVANTPRKYIIISVILGIVSSPLIWHFLKPYQKNRIIAFLKPESDPFGTAYNIIQSQIAIGSGKIFGKGFLQGTQSKLFFLPEQHTDFIFSTIGEEWGFVISAILIFLYLFIGLRIIYWGNKTEDLTGKYICYMGGSLISFQAFINIAMTMGLAPAVGIPLPMISYGGSSLLTFLILIGIILNIIKQTKSNLKQISFHH